MKRMTQGERRRRDDKLMKFLRVMLFHIPLVLWVAIIVILCVMDVAGGAASAALSGVFMIPWLIFAYWFIRP